MVPVIIVKDAMYSFFKINLDYLCMHCRKIYLWRTDFNTGLNTTVIFKTKHNYSKTWLSKTEILKLLNIMTAKEEITDFLKEFVILITWCKIYLYFSCPWHPGNIVHRKKSTVTNFAVLLFGINGEEPAHWYWVPWTIKCYNW